MPHLHDLDERIARLQRVAYGADAGDAERAAAAAELAALREARDAPDLPADDLRPESGTAPDALPARAAAPATATAPPTRGVRADLRTVLPYSAAALVAGALLGWTLGSAAAPSEGAGTGVPVAEAAAAQVFDRPATPRDFVRYPAPLVDIDPDDTSRRLLLTRSDGVQLIAVRTADGANACLVLAVPVGRPATACTTDGRFPAGGLRAEISVQGVGVYLAGWDADGNARINTADAPTG